MMFHWTSGKRGFRKYPATAAEKMEEDEQTVTGTTHGERKMHDVIINLCFGFWHGFLLLIVLLLGHCFLRSGGEESYKEAARSEGKCEHLIKLGGLWHSKLLYLWHMKTLESLYLSL